MLYRTATSQRVREIEQAMYKASPFSSVKHRDAVRFLELEQELWDVLRAAAPEDLNRRQQALQSIWIERPRPKMKTKTKKKTEAI